MKVLVADIRAKIATLPANVRDLVTIDPDDASLATVKSSSGKGVYTVHIEPHKDDPGDKSILNSACPCDSRSLCWHVTAFYAVSYDLLPTEGFLPETGQEDAKPEEDALSAPSITDVSMEFINAAALWIGIMRDKYADLERRVSELEKGRNDEG